MCVDVTVMPTDVQITHVATDVHSGGSVSSLYIVLDIAQPGRLESDEAGKPELNEPDKPRETDGCQGKYHC